MALSEEDIAQIRSKFRTGAGPVAPAVSKDPQTGLSIGRATGGFGVGAPRPERGDPGVLMRGLERGGRLAGLAIGTGVAVNPLFAGLHLIPGVKDWLPDPTKIIGGAKEFWSQVREGDWDAAIEAYQDELDAGPGYWGAAEIAGSLIPTGGPAIAGTKLISAAPKLAGTLGKVLPATRGGVKVRRGIEEGLTEVGKVMKLPWEAEEALGRGALKGLGLTARSARHPMTGPLAQAMAKARASIPDTPVGRAFGIDEGVASVDMPTSAGVPSGGKWRTEITINGETVITEGTGAAPRMSGKRSSQAWSEIYEQEGGIKIRDADGWDRTGDFQKDWNKKITQTEFEAKLGKSTTEQVPPKTPPPDVGDAMPGTFESGGKFVNPLRHIRDVIPEIKEVSNRVLRALSEKSPFQVNPSALRGSQAHKIATAVERLKIDVDQSSDLVVSAALDVHAAKLRGMAEILPIDKDGFFGDTGKMWHDVFSNYKNPAYKLTKEQTDYVEDFLRVIDEVEEMRVAAGLEPLAQVRKRDQFYIPRSVEEVRNLEVGATKPKLRRMYQEATEGFEQGVQYVNDPRATLLTHVRAAYKEVLESQLDEMIEPISIKIDMDILKHIPAGRAVLKRFQKALDARDEAKKAVKEKRYSAEGKRKINQAAARIAAIEKRRRDLQRGYAKGAPELRRTPEGQRLRDAAREPLERELESAKALRKKLIAAENDKLGAVRKKADNTLKKARAARTAKVEEIKVRKRVPGKLFGPDQPKEVRIREWKNRFFKEEDYLDLERGLERAMVPGAPTKELNKFWRGFQTVGNTIRFLAAVGDSGMPLIHGLPLLARNPAGWARMAYHHTNAFFDPAVQAKLIRDNLAEYQWLARNGVPIGDPEFFAALAPGQGLSLEAITRQLARVTGDDRARGARLLLQGTGKQVFGRFQAAYNTGLGWSRVELLKAVRGGWKGTDAELAQYIRNMTGGLDSRALGVGPTQRSIEGMFLAFSPRLLRSTTALMIDAARPWTPQGREALISLGRLAGGVLTLYTLSGIALGNAQGKTMEEIRKDTLEGMNPLSGRRFLSHNINGDWIGVGGQIRALTQFMASMYSTLAPDVLPGGEQPLKSVMSANMYENPFMRFYASRGAPGVSMVAGALEATTGVDALPFDQIDGPIDLGKHLVTSALPFTLQSALDGAQLGTVATEFFGLRGGTDPRDVRSQEVFDEEYRDIEPFMQRIIRETVEGQESEFDKIEQGRRDQLLELLGEVRSGQRRDSFGIWLEVRKINNRAAGARRYAGEGIEFETADIDADKLGLQALNQRNELYDDPEVMSETGRMKYVTVGGKRVSVFSRKLAAIEMGWSEAQKGFVVRNTNTRPIPIELVAVLPEEQRRSIGLSQTAREQYLIDRGNREEAQLLRRLFSLEPVGK